MNLFVRIWFLCLLLYYDYLRWCLCVGLVVEKIIGEKWIRLMFLLVSVFVFVVMFLVLVNLNLVKLLGWNFNKFKNMKLVWIVLVFFVFGLLLNIWVLMLFIFLKVLFEIMICWLLWIWLIRWIFCLIVILLKWWNCIVSCYKCSVVWFLCLCGLWLLKCK